MDTSSALPFLIIQMEMMLSNTTEFWFQLQVYNKVFYIYNY